MQGVWIILLFYLALLAGIVVLQVFLSKLQSRWFGLILPAITLCFSVLMVLGIGIYQGMSGGEVAVLIGGTFVMGNIPTIVLLAIYFGCREKIKAKSQLDKMNIQDL